MEIFEAGNSGNFLIIEFFTRSETARRHSARGIRNLAKITRILFKKESFWKTGGWDERFKCFGETAMWQNANNSGLQWTDRTGAIITHIMAATNHSKDSKLWNDEQGHDAKLLKKYYSIGV